MQHQLYWTIVTFNLLVPSGLPEQDHGRNCNFASSLPRMAFVWTGACRGILLQANREWCNEILCLAINNHYVTRIIFFASNPELLQVKTLPCQYERGWVIFGTVPYQDRLLISLRASIWKINTLLAFMRWQSELGWPLTVLIQTRLDNVAASMRDLNELKLTE